MKVLLVDPGIGAYAVSLANALADLVDLTFIQPERLAAPWLSQMNPKIDVIFCELPRIREPRSPLAVPFPAHASSLPGGEIPSRAICLQTVRAIKLK